VRERRTRDRRAVIGVGGRRATDYSLPLRVLAEISGMSTDFFLKEIEHQELQATQFGREWRVPTVVGCRYLQDKGWPIPPWLERACKMASAPDAA
jgi:hypothetical protein